MDFAIKTIDQNNVSHVLVTANCIKVTCADSLFSWYVFICAEFLHCSSFTISY